MESNDWGRMTISLRKHWEQKMGNMVLHNGEDQISLLGTTGFGKALERPFHFGNMIWKAMGRTISLGTTC
jgi:hypothetical protein